MAPRNMNPEANIVIYRRLTATDGDSMEEAARGLRHTLAERVAPPGRSAAMEARAFEFGWSRRHYIRPVWQRAAMPLLASSLVGTIALMAAMGL